MSGRNEKPAGRLTEPRLEVIIDAVVSTLLASGLLQIAFLWRGYDIPLRQTVIVTVLLMAVLAVLVHLRWWLAIILAIVLPAIALLLVRLSVGPVFFQQQLTGTAIWFEQFIQFYVPAPAVRYLPQAILSLPVAGSAFFLSRKTSRLLPFIVPAGLALILVLFRLPSAWTATLLIIAAVLVQMPRSLVQLIARERPGEKILPRGAMQILAMILAALVLSAANYFIPAHTQDWRMPALAYWARDIQDLWQNLGGTGRGWPTYNLVYYGYENPDTQLGAPVIPSRQPILMSVSTRSLLLKGSTRSIYTGTSWQRPLQDSYRLNSPVWRSNQREAFSDPLSRTQAGRQFASYWRASIEVKIQHRSTQMTLFQAGLIQAIKLDNPVQNVPFFTRDGDLFSVATLAKGEAYTIESLYLDRRREGFVPALLSFEKTIDPEKDPFWLDLKARYLQLPENLPSTVPELARSLTDSIDSVYGRAEAIEQYLQTFGTYTQATTTPSPGNDFVADFLEKRQGYCVHYASAMVVMSRCIGIPARFVEGVAISPASDSAQFLATGAAAHAWAELYFPGIGWMAFDATPAAPQAPPRGDDTRPERPEPSPDSNAQTGSEADRQKNQDRIRWFWILALIPLVLFAGILLLKGAAARHHRTFSEKWLLHHYPGRSERLIYLFKDVLLQLACLGLDPEPGETLIQFSRRIEDHIRLENLPLPTAFWPVNRLLYGSIDPSDQEIADLLQVRSRLEQRLQEVLPSWTYRFKRILAR